MNVKILVIIAILSVFIAQNLFAQEMGRHWDGNQNQCFQKLDLTAEQQETIETFKLNHQMQMIDLKANLKKKILELAKLKNNGKYTREEFINKVKEINLAKDAIAIAKANFKMDIYEILDVEQKNEWNKLSLNRGERKENRMKKSKRQKNSD